VGAVLQETGVALANGAVTLTLPKRQQGLASGPVVRRLEQLGAALGKGAEVQAS
jgi:hypothetical protein